MWWGKRCARDKVLGLALTFAAVTEWVLCLLNASLTFVTWKNGQRKVPSLLFPCSFLEWSAAAGETVPEGVVAAPEECILCSRACITKGVCFVCVCVCVCVCVFIGSLIKLCQFQQYKKWRISKYKKRAKTKWPLWLFIMCHAHCILRDQSFETYKCMKEKFSWCIVFKLTSRDSSRCLYIVTWNDPLKCRKRHSLPQLKVRQFTFNVRAISTIAFCFLVCLGSLDKKNLINVQNNIISGASQNKSPTLISVNSNHIKNLIERNATLVWCALSWMK